MTDPTPTGCERCAATPPEFAAGLRLWHAAGHPYADRNGIHLATPPADPTPPISQIPAAGWKTYEQCTRAQLINTCYGLNDMREKAIADLRGVTATVDQVLAERDRARATAVALEQQLGAITALHFDDGHGWCDADGYEFPCPTSRLAAALDGEPE